MNSTDLKYSQRNLKNQIIRRNHFKKLTKKIKLDSVLYQSGESFIWGPENSNEFNLKVSLYYLDFNKKYQEFKETEEDVFEYQFILDSEE